MLAQVVIATLMSSGTACRSSSFRDAVETWRRAIYRYMEATGTTQSVITHSDPGAPRPYFTGQIAEQMAASALASAEKNVDASQRLVSQSGMGRTAAIAGLMVRDIRDLDYIAVSFKDRPYLDDTAQNVASEVDEIDDLGRQLNAIPYCAR